MLSLIHLLSTTIYIKDLTKTKNNTTYIPITLDQTHVCNDIDKANLFNTYSHSVYAASLVGAPNIDSFPSVSINVSEADVYYALTTLDPACRIGWNWA